MSRMFIGALAFNQDIGDWVVHGVRGYGMWQMFYYASAFDQYLVWCVADDVHLSFAFTGTQCESTSCGVVQVENSGDCTSTGNVMANGKIRIAVARWLSDSAAAEATYGHISTWETGAVTDMEELFRDSSFNEDIGAWDTSGVTTMDSMFKKHTRNTINKVESSARAVT